MIRVTYVMLGVAVGMGVGYAMGFIHGEKLVDYGLKVAGDAVGARAATVKAA